MAKRVSIPLDGLGMDERAMLDLVNRLNKHDDRKWVFVRGGFGYAQYANPLLPGDLYQNQVANPITVQ